MERSRLKKAITFEMSAEDLLFLIDALDFSDVDRDLREHWLKFMDTVNVNFPIQEGFPSSLADESAAERTTSDALTATA